MKKWCISALFVLLLTVSLVAAQQSTLPVYSESVKCVFDGATSRQTCYLPYANGKTRFSCSSSKGTNFQSCAVKVYSRVKNEKLQWKSTCGGYATTIINNEDERAVFQCAAPIVKEEVKCVFEGATSEQKCYTKNGYSCTSSKEQNYESCAVQVSSKNKDQKLEWKSTCGGYATTIINNEDERAVFLCGSVIEPLPVYSEEVKCVFNGATSEQECYTAYGQRCRSSNEQNFESCAVKVSSKNKNQKLEWKSTCGGYATTIINNEDERAVFQCAPREVKEEVKCVFEGASSEQRCYTASGSECSSAREQNYESCKVRIGGQVGDVVEFKSTCGGYVRAVIGGDEDRLVFQCAPPAEIKEVVKCVFEGASSEQRCYTASTTTASGRECTSTKEQNYESCKVSISGQAGDVVEFKSSCGGYARAVIGGYEDRLVFQCAEAEPTYTGATWSCHDGFSFSGNSPAPVSGARWRKTAETTCEGRCTSEGKCGVNRFTLDSPILIEPAPIEIHVPGEDKTESAGSIVGMAISTLKKKVVWERVKCQKGGNNVACYYTPIDSTCSAKNFLSGKCQKKYCKKGGCNIQGQSGTKIFWSYGSCSGEETKLDGKDKTVKIVCGGDSDIRPGH